MTLEQAQRQTATRCSSPDQTETRLQGYWLPLARVGWMVILVLALGVFVVNIPFNFADAHIMCIAAACRINGGLTLARVQELHHLGLSLDFYAFMGLVLSAVLEAGYVATGVLIFWRRSDNRMALIASLALVTFGSVFHNPIPLATQPPLLHVLTLWMAFLGGTCLGLFFYTFPVGQFAPRWVGLLVLAWMAYWGFHDLAIADSFSQPGLDMTVFLSLLASVVVLQVYRHRRFSTPAQRQQTKWVVFGLSVAMLGSIVLLAVQASFSLNIIAGMVLGGLLYLFLLLIPLSFGIAILRYQLWDIDLIIKRTLVYGILTACIIGLYILVVVVLGELFHTGSNLVISLLATGLVAVLFQPLRVLLQRGVNRLIYGQRDEPYRVIAQLGQRLEATFTPDAVLSTIVETIAQALKLPYAAILLPQDQSAPIATSYGSMSEESLLRLPLLYQSKQVGELLLAPRARGETFTPADRRLLADLARQVGIAAHAVQLTTDLQRSREHLVIAREEERRRLRRDLHDGLGPSLASIALKLDAARNLLRRDPSAAESLLIDLKQHTQAAVTDIRRLAYELRPPSLDELGLVPALREQAEQYHIDGLYITLDAPESLPELPAAVEVAAYRIVQEAMTNVARHAQAHMCTIRFALDQGLDVEVCDDGRGIPVGQRAGVGLTSIRERAAELAGRCEIEALPAGGTRLHVRLPLPTTTEREE